MLTGETKKGLFKLWDTLGGNPLKSFRYIQTESPSWEEYYELYSEYKGVDFSDYLNDLIKTLSDSQEKPDGVDINIKPIKFKKGPESSMDITWFGIARFKVKVQGIGKENYTCKDKEYPNCFWDEFVRPHIEVIFNHLGENYGINYVSLESWKPKEKDEPLDENISSGGALMDVEDGKLIVTNKNNTLKYKATAKCYKFSIKAYDGEVNLKTIELKNDDSIFGTSKSGAEFTINSPESKDIINKFLKGENKIKVNADGNLSGVNGNCECTFVKL
jgi:hypothetical protein